ncbi:MAG: DUF983 domain-containing protein [Actinomycetota bacterium]
MIRQIARGFKRRCPRCGEGKAFDSYFRLRTHCPVCRYPFEREEGYWTGAMIVNIAACEIWFFVLLVGVLIATAPDVDWGTVLIVALVTNGLLPIVFYPFSKTIWMALDLHFHPAGVDER